jgi:hypothetical protein
MLRPKAALGDPQDTVFDEARGSSSCSVHGAIPGNWTGDDGGCFELGMQSHERLERS